MAATTAAGDHCAGEPAARGLPPRLLGWMLFLVVLGTYLPALRHGFVCLDDNAYVTANRHVQAGPTGRLGAQGGPNAYSASFDTVACTCPATSPTLVT